MSTLETRAQRSTRRMRPADWPDPIYWVWRKLTSVRLAILLILVVAAFAAAGVIIPQVPPQLIDQPGGVAQHVAAQRGTWGPVTDVLAEFPWVYDTNGGVFNLFNQPYWFLVIGILALSITTCTTSRFPPIWRSVRRPPKRVNDAYFERARHRLAFATPGDPAQLVAHFRRHRFHVEVAERDGATYLFADRFAWAQLATFISHLALILLVLGTLITKFGGEEFQFWVGEGESRPLFATGGNRQQIQVIVDDAIARFSDQGQALDFRSAVRVTSQGEEIAGGNVTVNGPLAFQGFRLHQAAYWEHGAALQVRDAASGQVLYAETLFLSEQLFGPRVTITNNATGSVVAEEVVALQRPLAGAEGGGYTLIPIGDRNSLALVLTQDAEGAMQFHYARLPFAPDAPQGAALTSADLRLFETPPPAPRVRLYDEASGDLLLDAVISLDVLLNPEAGPSAGEIAVLDLPDGSAIALGFDSADAPAPGFFYFDFRDPARRGFLAAGGIADLGDVALEYVGPEPDAGRFGTLTAGQAQVLGAVTLTYGGAESVFFTTDATVPGGEGDTLILLERFGQARTRGEFNARGGEDVELAYDATATSSGGVIDRPARLGLGLGGGQGRLDLDAGEAAVVGGYEYTFLGPREFTGLNVRRDPGAMVFWVAIILGIFGLTLTFFLPRRRIWAKVTAQRTVLAGLAGHGVDLQREFGRVAQALGAPDAPLVTRGWEDE